MSMAHSTPIFLLLVLVLVASARAQVNSMSFQSVSYVGDARLCSLELGGNATFSMAVPGVSMTAPPVIRSLNLTLSLPSEHGGQNLGTIVFVPSASSATVDPTYPNEAHVQVTLPPTPASVHDIVWSGALGLDIVSNRNVSVVGLGLVSADVTTASGTSLKQVQVAGLAVLPGMNWAPPTQFGTFKQFEFRQGSPSNVLIASTTVSVVNTAPNVAVSVAGVCGQMESGGVPVAETPMCQNGTKPITVPANATSTINVLANFPVPTNASSPGASVLTQVFSGLPMSLQFLRQPNPAIQPCSAVGNALLPSLPTSGTFFKFLVDEVQVRSAPLSVGSTEGFVGFTLHNPIQAPATVEILSLTVFDNASNPMISYNTAAPNTTNQKLSLSSGGTASTTSPMQAAQSFPETPSATNAVIALSQAVSDVYLPVSFTATITVAGSTPFTVTKSVTAVTRIRPRFTPQNGCTASDQCPTSYCIPDTGQCADDPQTGCNSLNVTCGIGGEVLPSNTSTPSKPVCQCKCVAPCYTGPTCDELDTTLPTCTQSAVSAYQKSLLSGCGASPVSSSTTTTTTTTTTAAAAGTSGPSQPGGTTTLYNGFGFKWPASGADALSARRTKFQYPSWGQPTRFYHNKLVSLDVNFTSTPTAPPKYYTAAYRSAKDYADAVLKGETDVLTQKIQWDLLVPNGVAPLSFAESLQQDAMGSSVSEVIVVATGALDTSAAQVDMCFAKSLGLLELAILKKASNQVAWLTDQIAGEAGAFVVVATDLGGSAQLVATPPYDLIDNLPPSTTALTTAEVTASTAAVFNGLGGVDAPGASLNPRYKAETPNAGSIHCEGGFGTTSCLGSPTDHATWEKQVRGPLPPLEALVGVQLAPWVTVAPNFPQASAALEAHAKAGLAGLSSVGNCGTCKDATGACAATAEACSCRKSNAAPSTGAGAYGRLCNKCGTGGYAWFPITTSKEVCANGAAWSGSGCGHCPHGNTVDENVVSEDVEAVGGTALRAKASYGSAYEAEWGGDENLGCGWFSCCHTNHDCKEDCPAGWKSDNPEPICHVDRSSGTFAIGCPGSSDNSWRMACVVG